MLLFNFGKVPFQLPGSIVKIPFAYDIVAIEHGSCLIPQFSQIQLRINQLVEVLRLSSSGAIHRAPTFKREMPKPIRRGGISSRPRSAAFRNRIPK